MAYSIKETNYYKKQQPAKSEELLNYIEVGFHPMQQQDFNDEYYKTMDAIPLPFGTRLNIECKYSDPPCLLQSITATAYETNSDGDIEYDDDTGLISNPFLTINNIDYYAWGAIVNVTNNNPVLTTTTGTTTTGAPTPPPVGYCVIIIGAYPLKSQGKEYASDQDNTSILENRILKYQYPENHLIQKRTTAQSIATTLLATYVQNRKDINIDWRGNPALELTDIIEVPEYNKNGIYTVGNFTIYKHKIMYDGTLKSIIDARKIPATTTTTSAP